MEKGLKAFFYDYKYYLLPEGCGSVEELKAQKVVEVKRLKEELCMAPDFIYESMDTELLTIEAPERIFPAEVNLYTSKEYDEILRKQVDCVCQNCERYEDDGDESLNGHHREISLDGVCYIKTTKEEYWSFTRCVDVAWYWIAKSTQELKKYIDQKKHNKVQEIVLKQFGQFFLPYEIYGGVDEEGKYFLAFYASDYVTYGLRTVLEMIAETANGEGSPMKEEGWTVYPYIPKGALPKNRKPDYLKHPPRLFIKKDEERDEDCFYLYEPKMKRANEKKAELIQKAVYDYLCYCVGENVLLGGCHEYSVEEEIPENAREVTVEELEAALLKCAQSDGEQGVRFPATLVWEKNPFEEEENKAVETLPFKNEVQAIITTCPEFRFEKLDENLEGGNTIFERDFGIIYAYLYMPYREEESEAWKRDALMWYLGNLDQYPEPIREGKNGFSAKNVGITFTKEGVCLDVMVFDEKSFFRWLRHLTPVLQGLNVKIVTVKRDGTFIYDPNYRIVAEGSDWLN